MIKKTIAHKGFRRYFKNTSWLFVEKILRMTVGMFVGIWVARFLGPENYGLLSYSQSIVALFAVIATLGLDGIVIRELVKNDKSYGELLGTSFILKIVTSIFLFLMLVVVTYLINNDTEIMFLVFIFSLVPIIQSFNVIDFYFQSKVLSKYVVMANSISMLISSIFKISLILNDADLIYFAWAICLDSFLIILGLIYFYLRQNSSFRSWTFNKSLALKLIKDSWPLMFSGLVVSFYMKIDQIMIKEMMDSQAVGYYAAAVRLSEALAFLPMIVSSSLFPAIINAKKYNKQLYYARLQKLYDFMVISTVVIALPVSFLSDWIITLLYGDIFLESSKVLTIYVWGAIFAALLVSSGKWYINENLAKYALMRNILGAILNVLLNIILIREYGISGAAIASVISYLFAGYLFDLFTKKTYRTFLLKTNSLNILSYFRRYKRYLKLYKDKQ